MKFWIQKISRVGLLGLLVCSGALRFAVAQESDEPVVIDRLSLRDEPLEGVLALLERFTGRAVIRPESLPTPKITFDSQGPLTQEEVVIALESLLSINGIGLAPRGDKFLDVVAINAIRTQAPELVISTLADREPSGTVVSKLFRLEYLDSQTFQQQIQPFMSPGFSAVIPFQNSNAVIVTDTVSNLQRLEYVVGEVDKPSKINVKTQFYTLQFAQASEVAQQLQTLIDNARNQFGDTEKTQATGNRNQATPNQPSPVPVPLGAEGSIPMQVLFGSNTAISSDDRTNQLIIMADPSSLVFFDEIIAKLDVKADPNNLIEVINLKHAQATEVASLLSQLVSGRSGSESSDRSQADQGLAPVSGRPGPFDSRLNLNPPAARGETRSIVPSGAVESTDDRDSQFSSFMTIIADERSNSLLVSGTRGDLELIRVLVADIDVLLAQVQIEVIIVDVNLSNNVSRGSEVIQGIYDDLATQRGIALGNGATGEGATSAAASGFNILGVNLGGSAFDLEGGNVSNLLLNAVFENAKSNSDVNVLSVPTIVTTHNREASILVGSAVPIITSSQSSLVSDTSTRSSFQFQDIAIELTVKPLIGPNDIIQMEISQTVDEVADRVRIDGNDQPIIGRREASSFVSVRNGEMIMLGGLQRQNATASSGKPAIIGEIPIIGRLFSSKGKSFAKSELILFIRPIVMRTTEAVNHTAESKVDELEKGEAVKKYLETGEVDIRAKEKTKKKGWFGRKR